MKVDDQLVIMTTRVIKVYGEGGKGDKGRWSSEFEANLKHCW